MSDQSQRQALTTQIKEIIEDRFPHADFEIKTDGGVTQFVSVTIKGRSIRDFQNLILLLSAKGADS